MKKLIKYFTIPFIGVLLSVGCEEHYITYDDAEYIMFADTLATYAVDEAGVFTVPVVSTVVRDYDRTFGVEVIDEEGTAVESLHYNLPKSTYTIKAGENRVDVEVHGLYENIETSDSLVICLQLLMNSELEMPLYGSKTKAEMMKACPFDINDYCGWTMLTSMFLYDYSITPSYQRLIRTEKHPTLENTIIMKNWMADGYDVNLTFHNEDLLNRTVTMSEDQVMSDGGSFFGTIYGDDKLLVKSSTLYDSYFYPCGKYLLLWAEIYMMDMGELYGTVGHFYNVMEWVSDEEADRLKREEGM